MLQWMRSAGYRVLLVLCPTAEQTLDRAQIRKLEEVGPVILCERTGRITYSLRAVGDVLAALNGRLIPAQPTIPREVILCIIKELVTKLGRSTVLTTPTFASWLFPSLSADTLKIVDAGDIFRGRAKTSTSYESSDGTLLGLDDVREQFMRADLVLTASTNESRELAQVTEATKTLVVGFDCVSAEYEPATHDRQILYVGSDNRTDRQGLQDFLKYGWPSILRSVPDAKFFIVGEVCRALRSTPESATLLACPDDLEPAYRAAKVIINPCIAGPAPSVRTLEALRHLRPIITWPAGVEGLDTTLSSMCAVVTDWYEFNQSARTLLLDDRNTSVPRQYSQLPAHLPSAGDVYAPLKKELQSFFFKEEQASA